VVIDLDGAGGHLVQALMCQLEWNLEWVLRLAWSIILSDSRNSWTRHKYRSSTLSVEI
jgi:hypothetical protein